MLKQHKFYLYYDGGKVFARMDKLAPVLAREFADGKNDAGELVTAAQAAHDYVQSVVNPDGHHHSKFGHKGFHAEEFQRQISPNCEAVVTAAYAAAAKAA